MNLLMQIAASAALVVSMAASASAGAVDPTMVLDATRAGTRIVGVGEHGIVLLSDDDGKTMQRAAALPTDMDLTALSFPDARNGWAVGHGGVILQSADAGASWRLQRQETTRDRPLLTVYFRDSLHGWAAGLWSLLLATSDGGASWQQVMLPVPPGAKRADLNLLKVFGAPDGTMYIAAERGMVLRSADGGASWQYLSTGSAASLWSGAALADGTLVVGGLGGRILRSGDKGASWTEVDGKATSGSITQIVADGAGVWAASASGVLLHSSDAGQHWQPSGVAGAPLTALVAGGGQALRFGRLGATPAPASVGK